MSGTKARTESFSFRDVAIGSLVLVVGLFFIFVVLSLLYEGTFTLVSNHDSIGLTVSGFVVFSTAVIGVGGSYYIYRRRRQDTEQRLCQAVFAEIALVGDQIYAEVRDMTVSQLDSELYVPDESPIVLNAYRNNAGEIGRLSQDEVEKLTSFYTLATIVRPRIERVIQRDDVEAVEVSRLRTRLIKLFNRRNAAIEAMKQELSRPPVEVKHEAEIEEGDDLEELVESLGDR